MKMKKPTQKCISEISTKTVISVPPTMTIIDGIQMMTKHNFRRLPITNPGTKKLIGIVTLTDVIDMMGGGNRYNLVANKHNGNLLSALNENIREIATENVVGFCKNTSIKEAAQTMVKSGHGGFPILNSDNTISGIVTEYDIMKVLLENETDVIVEEVMTKNPEVIKPDLKLSKVTATIVDRGYRRLPVASEGILIGIITATDIMNYIGKGRIFKDMSTGTVDEVLNLPVKDVMTSADIRTVNSDMPINLVAKEMVDKGIGAFPVLDGNKISGIITEFDLVKSMCKNI